MNRICTLATLISVAILVSACAANSAGDAASGPVASITAPTTTPEAPQISPSASPTAAPSSASPGAPSIAADEPWIVYEGPIPGGAGNRLVRPDGQDDHWATPDIPRPADGWQVHPDWSPDGMRLAFAVDDTDGASRDLWISEPDGANAERVFDCQGPCHDADFPAWSRDGMTIAFASWDEVDGKATESRLELLDVATGQVRTIAQAEGLTTIQNPRWSPNGNAIVLELAHWTDLTSSADIDGVKIGVVDVGAATSAVRMITDPALLATYPDWHPTKDLIVFSTRRWDQLEGPSNLFTIRSDGTGQTQITDFKAGETRAVQPTWTPDGSLIIFTAVEGSGFGNPTMATIKPDGTALTSATSSGPMFGTHPRLRPMP